MGGVLEQRGSQAVRYLTIMLKQVEYATGELVRVVTKIAGHGAVRVQVDHQHLLALVRQQASQCHGGRGFTHSPFLVGNGPDSHTFPPRARHGMDTLTPWEYDNILTDQSISDYWNGFDAEPVPEASEGKRASRISSTPSVGAAKGSCRRSR